MNSDNQSTTPPSQSHELPSQISQQAATSAENDIPPDGGYGWGCVASTFWINSHTWGINSVRTFLHTKITLIVTLASDLVCVAYHLFIIDQKSFGVFLAYYLSHDLFPGTSSFEYAFIGGFQHVMRTVSCTSSDCSHG